VRGQEWGRAIQYRTEYTVYTYSEEGHAKYMKSVNAVFKKKTEVFCPRSLASEIAGYSCGFNTQGTS
jgi:hypothetical protein